MEDEQIIDLFFARSELAIAELGEKYGRDVLRLSQRILNSASDAEECLNDAYLGMWNSIPPQRPEKLKSYFFRIVRNLSIKKYHEKTAAKRNSIYDASLEELEGCLSSSSTAETELDAKETARCINEFLAALEKDSRVMFVRRYWYSQSISEIAAAFGISENSAAVRLSRTRSKLQKFLSMKGVL